MRHGRGRSFASAAAVLVAAATPIGVCALGAQAKGTSVFVAGVADAETGQPLEGAEVLLVEPYQTTDLISHGGHGDHGEMSFSVTSVTSVTSVVQKAFGTIS